MQNVTNKKTVAIMQPYFLPYIGYFQLIHAVDEFIIYDRIQFTKKGWIHRNRMLQNKKDEYFSLPLKKGSDYLDICERHLSDSWPKEREKILRKIRENYQKAPYFGEAFPIIETIFQYPDDNLFNFVFYSVKTICEFLEIDTKITISSTIAIDPALKAQDRVMALTKAAQGHTYLNPIGGFELYDTHTFKNEGIELQFHKARPIEYLQGSSAFVPWLSILDVMMFNPKSQIINWLTHFDRIHKDE